MAPGSHVVDSGGSTPSSVVQWVADVLDGRGVRTVEGHRRVEDQKEEIKVWGYRGWGRGGRRGQSMGGKKDQDEDVLWESPERLGCTPETKRASQTWWLNSK